MIDLSKHYKLYEIKMPDGEIMKIKKPSQGFLMDLCSIAKMCGEDRHIDISDMEQVLGLISGAAARVFSLNTEGVKYTPDMLDDMGIDAEIQMEVIKDYLDFYFGAVQE